MEVALEAFFVTPVSKNPRATGSGGKRMPTVVETKSSTVVRFTICNNYTQKNEKIDVVP